MNQRPAKIFLKRGRANPLWRGHPWVFSGAVERTERPYEPGDLVEVCDLEGRLIGRGLANPRSQILVRLLTRKEEPLDPAHPEDLGTTGLAAFIAARVRAAAELRLRLGFPTPREAPEGSDAFRLVNAEGDGLPGLIIDRFGPIAVVQIGTLGMKRNEVAILDALDALPPALRPTSILEAPSGGFAQLEGFVSAARVLRGEAPAGPVACREAGVALEVEPLSGQKTGMFLDQRDNRVLFGKYAKGRRVLDVYSYAGGFALQALRQGAASAICVDSSERALSRARNHAALNGFKNLETVEADAFRYLEGAAPLSQDLVVIDPPKFARAQKDLPAALKGYQRLNALALNVVARGGLMATCSCSQLVDEESFDRLVAAAAQDAGRRVTVLHRGSQGVDHPVLPGFPEGRYLKFALLAVD